MILKSIAEKLIEDVKRLNWYLGILIRWNRLTSLGNRADKMALAQCLYVCMLWPCQNRYDRMINEYGAIGGMRIDGKAKCPQKTRLNATFVSITDL
jgi:hypothetical protein